jgi:hypothetical protein
MRVLVTKYLQEQLKALRARVQVQTPYEKNLGFLKLDYFIEEFTYWKSDGAFSNWQFGKDGFYENPKSSVGKMCLRHVHLPPIFDVNKRRRWELIWNGAIRGHYRTSNTILVYAEDAHYGYLLIQLLIEPDGHKVADRRTQEHAELMQDMVDEAELFQHTGTFTM